MSVPVNQSINNKPWLWKKGQSGNPKGRPKGRSLKEWTRAKLAEMTDEERMAFLNGITLDIQWKMAEGNPEQHTDIDMDAEIREAPSFTAEEIAKIKAGVRKRKLAHD